MARARATKLAKVADRDEFIANYKLSRGCADCGYKAHPRALDFDHIGDKSFTIGGVNRESKSMVDIVKEIEKCEVVCSNCHRVRTFNREQAKKTAKLADALPSA